LGYYFDEDLSWKAHIDAIETKVLQVACRVERARADVRDKSKMVNADVFGIATFSADVVPYSNKAVHRMQKAGYKARG
jgi:hypothetical protein